MYRSIDSSRVRNLKLIAQLKVGDKLCTRYHHYSIDSYGPFSIRAVTRLINGESRNETIDSLTQLVESCINQHGIAPDEKRRLANEFKEGVKGIQNLVITYRGDKSSCVGLQLILDMMEEYVELFADKDPVFVVSEEDNSILSRSPTPHPIVDEGITQDVDLEEEEVTIE